MIKLGASSVTGLDLDISQAKFVKDHYSKQQGVDFSALSLIDRDVCKEGLADLGKFDFVCLFCVVYHFQKDIDLVMSEIAKITNRVVMQGNLPREKSDKYRDRVGTEYSGIEGMRGLLKKHGFSKIHIFSLNDYPKPVVIGEKD